MRFRAMTTEEATTLEANLRLIAEQKCEVCKGVTAINLPYRDAVGWHPQLPSRCPDCIDGYANPEFRRECPSSFRWGDCPGAGQQPTVRNRCPECGRAVRSTNKNNVRPHKYSLPEHDETCNCAGRAYILPPTAELDRLLLSLPNFVYLESCGTKDDPWFSAEYADSKGWHLNGEGNTPTQTLAEAVVRANGPKGE